MKADLAGRSTGGAQRGGARSAERFARVIVYGLACVALPVLAGPPFMTDDPEPADYKHHEFYIAAQQVRTADGRSGTMPHLEYNYGVAPDVHLHIIAPYVFNRPEGGLSQRGYGDTELGIKYRFVRETETRPMVGAFPILLLPSGNESRGLGNGHAQLLLPLWVQKRWGKWQSYGGGGYWIDNAPGAKNHWFYGWQVQKDLTEHLTLGGELFHSTEAVAGEGSSTGFNLGGYYSFDEHNHLLFSAGEGLTNARATNRFSSYAAYQWTW